MILIIIPTTLIDINNTLETLASIFRNTKEEYDLLIVKNNNRGFAPAINHGLITFINNKNYDSCILINDDVIFASEYWVRKLLKDKDKYDIISCTGNIQNEPVKHVAFWCTYIKREVIEKIGLLDERFLIGECEDVDYCIRALDAGFKISDSECEAFHKSHGTLQHLNEDGMKIIKNNKNLLKEKYKGTKWKDKLQNV